MTHELPLRSATPADLPTLMRHRRLMFVDMARAEGKEISEEELARMDPAYAEYVRCEMPAGNLHAWVAEGPEGIVSSCVLVTFAWPPKPSDLSGRAGYLCSMYTEPAYRRRGLARRIVSAAIDECRRRNIGCLLLSASPDGLRIYERLGFRPWETFMRLRVE